MADSLLPKDRKKQLMQEITLEPAEDQRKEERKIVGGNGSNIFYLLFDSIYS